MGYVAGGGFLKKLEIEWMNPKNWTKLSVSSLNGKLVIFAYYDV